MREKFRTLFELTRVSNVLTLLSNTLLGFFLAGGSIIQQPLSYLRAFFASASLYIAGMILNDLLDQEQDQIERPTRPLPSGRVTPFQAWLLFLVFVLQGLLLSPNVLSVFLLVAILLYNLFHSHAPPWISAILMAICRATVILIGGLSAHLHKEQIAPQMLIVAGLVALYTVGLTLFARDEVDKRVSLNQLRAWRVCVATFALAGFLFLRHANFQVVLVGTLIVYFGLRKTRELEQHLGPAILYVLSLIAGFSLLDAWILSVFSAKAEVGIALACFLLTPILQRKSVGA